MIFSKGRVVMALLFFLAGCTKDSDKAGPAVARGDGVLITRDEFRARLDEQPPLVRARYSTLDRKRELLENLIRLELLAHEAREQKLDQDPDVQAALKQAMIQKLVRKSIDENKESGQASDAEVKAYYDEHPNEFVTPERVRVSQILLRADWGSPGWTKKAEEARKVYARLKAAGAKNPTAFANMALSLSEDFASKPVGGDLGYRTHDDLQKQYSREVADAAFALKDIGQESGVIESPQGFHILKLASRQAALSRSLNEVGPLLAARLGGEKRRRALEDYVKKLREKASITIDDAELRKIAVTAAPVPQTGASQVTTPGPQVPGSQRIVLPAAPPPGGPAPAANR